MTDKDYTQQSKVRWSAVAKGWKDWAPTLERAAQHINECLIAQAKISRGQKVLDLASGSGEPLLSAAAAVGPEGLALATDLTSEMLAMTRERAEARGLTNIVYRVADAQVLDIPESGFDAVTCRWGLMLMARPTDCLDQVFKRLKSGGSVAMAVFDRPPPDPSVATVFRWLREELNVDPPDPKAPGMFRLSDKEELRALFEHAGFSSVEIETLKGCLPFNSPGEYLNYVNDISNENRRLLEGQTPERKKAITKALEQRFAGFSKPDGSLEIGFAVHCVTGQKP